MSFFFKQKTAYELRISDWSSDVCSSDLQVVSTLLECERDDAALRARGLLPPGYEGAGFAADARIRATILREAVAEWRGGASAERIERAIALPGMVLDPRIADVHEGRRAVATAGSRKGEHWLRALLETLELAAPLGEPRTSD